MKKHRKSLSFLKLTENAKIPTKGSNLSAGYDLSSAYDYIIPPGNVCRVSTDLVLRFPSGCYGRLAIRSSLAVKGVDVLGGVVDPDYTGNLIIILINHSKNEFEISKGQRVAQIICEKIKFPKISETSFVDYTKRNVKGFGSSGL